MPRNFRPEKSVPKKVYVPAKTRQSTLPPKKVSNFFARDARASCGDVRGLEKVYVGRHNTAKKHFYIKEALVLTVYAARRHVCYNLSSRVEYATIPKLRSIRSRTAHMDL